MTLHELESQGALTMFQSEHANTLICFSATWCGPCKASKPQLVALAADYENDSSVDLHVGIVYEHNLGDALQNYGVKAFPTYILWEDHGRREVGRIAGANFPAIKQMIQRSEKCVKSFGTGEGKSLGGAGIGDSSSMSADELRQQRLARMSGQGGAEAMKEEGVSSGGYVAEKEEAVTSNDVEMTDAGFAANDSEAAAKTDSTEKTGMDTDMVDPTDNLDKEALEELTSAMGFSLIRAQKGLLNGGNTSEGAVNWLLEHQDDPDIDDPIAMVPEKGAGGSGGGGDGAVAQSYKCNECGKILSNMANLELHANKTGHSDFEESTTAVKPLTAEEKAAKVEELKALLAAKRAEREQKEKEDNVAREKQRRFMGQEMAKTREQMEVEKRKRDAIMRKKEKDAFKKERERIRAELAKDKAERKAHGGKLSSKLGAEGYKPDGIQYDAENGEGGEGEVKEAPKTKPKSQLKVDDCIKKVSQYRAGGDGGKCLKVLLAYVKNVADNDDEKYRTINMDNKAYKAKVKPFIGGKQLLLAVGFVPNESGNALVLSPDADKKMLAETKKKLQDALSAY